MVEPTTNRTEQVCAAFDSPHLDETIVAVEKLLPWGRPLLRRSTVPKRKAIVCV